MFVARVVFGVLVVWRWPRMALLHLPALAWGIWIEASGRVCPLTPLEVSLRREAGQSGYTGGFLDHYVGGIVYPAGLTRGRSGPRRDFSARSTSWCTGRWWCGPSAAAAGARD